VGTPTPVGWPFLVAAGRRRDYTILLAPDFLVADLDHGVLERVTGPDGEDGRPTTVDTRSGRGRRSGRARAAAAADLRVRDAGRAGRRTGGGRPGPGAGGGAARVPVVPRGRGGGVGRRYRAVPAGVDRRGTGDLGGPSARRYQSAGRRADRARGGGGSRAGRGRRHPAGPRPRATNPTAGRVCQPRSGSYRLAELPPLGAALSAPLWTKADVRPAPYWDGPYALVFICVVRDPTAVARIDEMHWQHIENKFAARP
jgi:hypothetical protein